MVFRTARGRATPEGRKGMGVSNRRVSSTYARKERLLRISEMTSRQGRPLGGVSGAHAPGADFEGAPKRQSPTSHTSILRMVISSLANKKSLKGFLFLIWLY
jgi:hypothetical protein